MTAAKYLDCLGRESNDAVWKFIATVYDQSGTNHRAERRPDAEGLRQRFRRQSGRDRSLRGQAGDREAGPRLDRLGQKLDVNSTPTFFINGRRVVGFNNNGTPYDAVKSMVDFELNGK